MTPERLVRIYFSCIRHAENHGAPEHATDFAAWFVVELLDGRRAKQSTGFAFVDFLAVEFGGTNRSRGNIDNAGLRVHCDPLLLENDDHTSEEALDRMAWLRGMPR